MDRKIKLIAATSLLGLTAVACAPNPYYYQSNPGARAATNGYAVNRGGVAASGVAVTHTHCGRTHTHVMPAGQHQHGDGCMATNNAPTAATNRPSNYNQPPAVNTYTYGATTAPTTYDDTAGAGSNYYSAAGSSSSYYDYAAPKGAAAPANTYRSTTVAPRSTSPAAATNNGYYTVQKGDTVFAVMRASGVYWKDIIRLNKLQAPDYSITPGQRLKLK